MIRGSERKEVQRIRKRRTGRRGIGRTAGALYADPMCRRISGGSRRYLVSDIPEGLLRQAAIRWLGRWLCRDIGIAAKHHVPFFIQ